MFGGEVLLVGQRRWSSHASGRAEAMQTWRAPGSRGAAILLIVLLALLVSAPDARGQEAGLCNVVLALEQLQDEIGAASEEPGTGPSSAEIRRRLDTVGLGLAQYQRLINPEDRLSGLAAIMLEYSTIRDLKGDSAARGFFRADGYVSAVAGLRDLKEEHACGDMDRVQGSAQLQAAGIEADPTEGETYFGSRRQDDPYGFGHVSLGGLAIGGPLFLLALAAIAYGMHIARKMQARRQHYTCNVVVHVEGPRCPRTAPCWT